jgi:hypothetical protein
MGFEAGLSGSVRSRIRHCLHARGRRLQRTTACACVLQPLTSPPSYPSNVLVDSLFNAGLIGSRTFSFTLTPQPGQPGSQLIFGAPDLSLAKKVRVCPHATARSSATPLAVGHRA